MAGPYGVYELIMTLLVAAITGEEADEYTDTNSILLFWYMVTAIFTGVMQYLLHKGVQEWYFLEHTGSWAIDEEDVPENPEDNETENVIVGQDTDKSGAKGGQDTDNDAGSLFKELPVF